MGSKESFVVPTEETVFVTTHEASVRRRSGGRRLLRRRPRCFFAFSTLELALFSIEGLFYFFSYACIGFY